METINVEALLLGRRPYISNKWILSLYSKDIGFFSVLAYERKSFSVRKLLVLDQLELQLQPGKSDLYKAKEIHRCYAYKNLQFDVFKSSQVFLIAELLSSILKDAGKDENLYEYLINSFLYFDEMEKGKVHFYLFFLINLTRLLGISLENATSTLEELIRDYFQTSSLTTSFNNNGRISTLFARFLQGNASEIEELSLTREERKLMLQITLEFISDHFRLPEKVKTLEVFDDWN